MDSPFIVKLHYAFQSLEKLYLVVDFMAGVIIFEYVGRTFLFTQS